MVAFISFSVAVIEYLLDKCNLKREGLVPSSEKKNQGKKKEGRVYFGSQFKVQPVNAEMSKQ